MPPYCIPLYHYTPRLFQDFFSEKSIDECHDDKCTSIPLLCVPLYLHTPIFNLYFLIRIIKVNPYSYQVYHYTPILCTTIPPYFYQKSNICSASLSRKLLRAPNFALLLQPAALLRGAPAPVAATHHRAEGTVETLA